MNTAELHRNAINSLERTSETARSSETPPDVTSRSAPAKKRLRQRLIAATIVGLIVIGSLVLGYFPRWRQRRTATADMNELAIPTVSVVSPTLAKAGDGLTLPAEIRPWREASIFARANGYVSARLDVPTDHTEAWRVPLPGAIKTYTKAAMQVKDSLQPLLQEVFGSQ